MISRIFANALVRRLAAVIVAGVLAWMGIGRAHAAGSIGVCDYGQNCTRAQAFAAINDGAGFCNRWSPGATATYMTSPYVNGSSQYLAKIECQPSNPSSSVSIWELYTIFYSSCTTGTVWNESTGQCQESCSKAANYTGQGPWSSGIGSARNGSMGCRGGCDGIWYQNQDSTHTWNPTGGQCAVDEKGQCDNYPAHYWNAVLKVCEPVEVECTEGQVRTRGVCVDACPAGMIVQADGTCKNKANECPQGHIKAPSGACLPGEGQCAAGEAKGKDGSCKRDADGDGKPDAGEEEGTTDETFSGGDSCNAPPSCSGSPIMCGQARIQWRIDCNTRKNRNVSGGACSTMPICTGEKCDALEYSGLLMQWRTACATEKLAGKGNGDGDGSQPEWTKVNGMNQNPGAGEGSGDAPKLNEKKGSTDDLDQSGFGGGGGCIGFASGGGQGVTSGFLQTLASPPPLWCNFILALKGVFILIGAVVAVFIMSKGQ